MTSIPLHPMLVHFPVAFYFLELFYGIKVNTLRIVNSTAGIAKWINQNLPPNSKVLVRGEVRLFYFDRKTVLEEEFSLFSNYADLKTPAEISTLLKEKGFTHLLDAVSLQPGASPIESNTDLLIQDSSLVHKLFTMTSQNGREPKFIYNVYELV